MLLTFRPCSRVTVSPAGAPEISPPIASHSMLLPLLDSTSFVVLEFTDRLLPSTAHVFAGLHA